jgi:ribonuclease HI
MELMAVIQALKCIGHSKVPIDIYVDSQYVKLGIEMWIKTWKKNQWKTVRS